MESKDKIYLSIIAGLLVANLGLGKGLIMTASNKDIRIEIPPYSEPGVYVLSDTTASDSSYRMWAKMFTTEIANYSKDNIKEKITGLMQFLRPEKSVENKAKLFKTIEFVENNYVTQEFKIKEVRINRDPSNKSMVTVNVFGTLTRSIGLTKDPLSGSDYSYNYKLIVKNGQMLIDDMWVELVGYGKDQTLTKNIDANKYVHFDQNGTMKNDLNKSKDQNSTNQKKQ